MRNFLRFLLFSLFLITFSACSEITSPSVTESNQLDIPTPTLSELELLAQSIGQLNPDEILIQLDYEPTFSLPRNHFEFGRVPVFTLYADGRLIYAHQAQPGDLPRAVILSPLETAEFLSQVYEDGISELSSYEDQCQEQADGTQQCIADAAYSLISVRMRDGSEKKLRNYAQFSNQPEILAQVINRLSNYSSPDAIPYIPEQAALFLTPAEGEIDERPLDYPLNPPYAPPPLDAGETWALELQSGQINIYLNTTGGNSGLTYFMYGDQVYQVEFIPWLPGNTFSAGMAEAFPPTLIEMSEQHWLGACPLGGELHPSGANLRLVYINKGILYVRDEDAEELHLDLNGTVKDFILSPDYALAYLIVLTDQGSEIWGADLFLGEAFPVAIGFESDVDLVLHPVSDDNEWLAFSIKEIDHTGSLWVVRTNGEERKEIADLQELKSLQPDYPQMGAIPNNVQWVPWTHLLVYDSIPTGNDLFIYIPNNALIDIDSGAKRDYPSGFLEFSPDGRQVVAKQIDHLILANADGSDAHRLNVPYFAPDMEEFYDYPPILWSSDQFNLLVASPEKPEIQYQKFTNTPMSVYSVQLENERAFPMTNFKGLPNSLTFSPGGEFISYWSAPFQSNQRSLMIELVDGSERALYDNKVLIEFLGWSPDSRYFLYSFGEDLSYQRVMLGNPCSSGKPVFEGPHPQARWLDDDRFILEVTRIETNTSQLLLGDPSGEVTPLVDFQWLDESRWEAVLLP
jgi:hypothetical protein